MLRFYLLLLFFSAALFRLQGQATITGKRDICLNDLSNFNISVSGGTPVSYAWDFGSFGTSSNSSPTIKFTSTGKLTVKCTVTVSGGQQFTDTHAIEILPLPYAKFKLDTFGSKLCAGNNLVCFDDSSKKASRPLYKVSMVWGDGKLSQFYAPYSKKWCHTFPDSGWFTNIMELEDSAGCKSQYSVNVYVFPSIKHNLIPSEIPFCDSINYCILNKVSGGKTITNSWYNMKTGKSLSLSNSWCKVVYPETSIKYKLISENEFHCKDSIVVDYAVPPSLFKLRKYKSKICTNELLYGFVPIFGISEDAEWYLNGVAVGIDSIYHAGSDAHIGMNYVTVKRIGGCTGYILDSFEVLGTRAIGKVYNHNRQRIIDTIFVVDVTKYKSNAKSRFWDFGDSKAEKCTTDTKKGLNVNKNCNFSVDSIARHYYSDSLCYDPRLIVYDSVVGCFDDTILRAYRRRYCPDFLTPKTVCVGENAFFNMPISTREKVGNYNYLITDINGTVDNDTLVMYSGFAYYKYKTRGFKSPVFWGYYDDDTVWTERGGEIVIDYIRPGKGWVADTFFNKINVDPLANAQFDLQIISECDPFHIKINFKDSIFYYPDTIFCFWGDTNEYITQFSDTLYRLKSMEHKYKTGGLYHVIIVLKPYRGCEGGGYAEIRFSHLVYVSHDLHCAGEKSCFYDSVLQLGIIPPSDRWLDDTAYGNLYWDFGDGTKDTGYHMCHAFNSIGDYIVTLTARNKRGCDVYIKDTIRITGPQAKIKLPPPIFCSEIRQYFDSSTLILPNNGQVINGWNWNFGDGSTNSIVKNPVHVFPAGGDYTVKLKVRTDMGCQDSTTAVFHVVGPEVHARIVSDSAGCNPLNVEFTNISRQSKTFIWQFGDSNNSVFSTTRDTNVHFTYKKAGVYHARLIAGDSFYNPTTGSKYYCSVTYPPNGSDALKITVYETSFADFKMPDIFCVHDSVKIINTSRGDARLFHWDMGNGDTFTRKSDSFLYKYANTGKYHLKMYGKLNQPTDTACVDTADKIIEVIILSPDFSQECNPANGSELILKNLSNVQINGYRWTLLDPSDSSEKLLDTTYDLRYDFGKETGVKWVCLGLENSSVCGGRTCKQVFVQGDVFLANVFTPGKDGYNDTYKTPMQGTRMYHMRIYNRWGEMLFESDDPSLEWNGTVFNKGIELPSGTYFYTLKYQTKCDDKIFDVNGSITLIR